MVELGPVGAPDAVPDAIAQALGHHATGRDPRHRDRRGGSGRSAPADRGRQLRAPPGRCRGGDRAGRWPAHRRPGSWRRPASACSSPARRSCRCRPSRSTVGVTSDAVTLFVERAATVRPGLRHLRRADRRRGRRDLRDPRRPPAGHRARCGADGGDERARGARPTRRSVPAADRPRVRAAPAVDAGACGGVVLRPAGRRRARGTGHGVGVRGRLRPVGAVRRRRDGATRSRCWDTSTRWCASPWSSLTMARPAPGTACTRPSGRTPRACSPRPERVALRDRHAAHFASEAAARWESVERPRLA